jgi:hypothetical protein
MRDERWEACLICLKKEQQNQHDKPNSLLSQEKWDKFYQDRIELITRKHENGEVWSKKLTGCNNCLYKFEIDVLGQEGLDELH